MTARGRTGRGDLEATNKSCTFSAAYVFLPVSISLQAEACIKKAATQRIATRRSPKGIPLAVHAAAGAGSLHLKRSRRPGAKALKRRWSR